MRMEMARVALSLACSMSCSRAFGSVFATFRPDDRRRVPARSARTNSRCVCRRPSGVAYQSASSASDLNLGTLGDLRGIFPPLRRIHFVGGHGAEPLAPNREDHDQVAVGCCFPNSFPRYSPWTDRDFFDREGSDRMAQDVAHVGGVSIEAFDFVHPMLSIYDDRIYSQRGLLRR